MNRSSSLLHHPHLSFIIFFLLALISVIFDEASFVVSSHPFLPAVGRGGATTATTTTTTPISNRHPIRVAYQGEPGAYSEKSTRELLGPRVMAIGHPNFEACFRAVASMECDYACLPIENSLGGSIHENYDLMLRYDLTIVAEHEFRVHHCLLAKPGVPREDIKYAISHPQALAQCDNFLRSMGITPIPTYDTAGSAKMIADGNTADLLPEGCTPENTAAIASDLAGKRYGLHPLDTNIEDDDTNFTRFLLLARRGVAHFLTNNNIPSKTSIVFAFPNTARALYEALACFALRGIDCSKIESRPTSASLIKYSKFQQSRGHGKKKKHPHRSLRFPYCFYLDFLASEHDENTQNALSHLQEQADFLRILGSYPQKSRLVGPVKEAVEESNQIIHHDDDDDNEQHLSLVSSTDSSIYDDEKEEKPLRIGIVGNGPLAHHLATHFSSSGTKKTTTHGTVIVSCLDPSSSYSKNFMRNNNNNINNNNVNNIKYYPKFQTTEFLRGLDIVVLAVSLVDFEQVVLSLPPPSLRGKLIVEACSLNVYPKKILLNHCGTMDVDILSTNPMLGILSSGTGTGTGHQHGSTNTDGAYIQQQQQQQDTTSSWQGRPFVYEKVRITNNMKRVDRYLRIFEEARCQMVEMTADQHDDTMADAEFVTHLIGQLVDPILPPTPISTKEYESLCTVAETATTSSDDFLFAQDNDNNNFLFEMFQFHPRSKELMRLLRENLSRMERKLAAKEAYHIAAMEMKHHDRQQLIAETKLLIQEIIVGLSSEKKKTKKKMKKKKSRKNNDDIDDEEEEEEETEVAEEEEDEEEETEAAADLIDVEEPDEKDDDDSTDEQEEETK